MGCIKCTAFCSAPADNLAVYWGTRLSFGSCPEAKGGRTAGESPDGTFDAPVPFEMCAAAVQSPGQLPWQVVSGKSQTDPAGRGPAGVTAALIEVPSRDPQEWCRTWLVARCAFRWHVLAASSAAPSGLPPGDNCTTGQHHHASCGYVPDALTIATMPAFTAGGRFGHCSITRCRSTSRAAATVSTAAPAAAQLSECAGVPGVLQVCN